MSEGDDINFEELFDFSGVQGGAGDLPRNNSSQGNLDEDDNKENDNSEILNKIKAMNGAGKKIVKNPQPKLDAARLTGDRGIAIIPDVFKRVKFKGKHHEKEDLDKILAVLKHWGHRLFPKMTFNECLERCERLGHKKPIQTAVQRLRMGLPMSGEISGPSEAAGPQLEPEDEFDPLDALEGEDFPEDGRIEKVQNVAKSLGFFDVVDENYEEVLRDRTTTSSNEPDFEDFDEEDFFEGPSAKRQIVDDDFLDDLLK